MLEPAMTLPYALPDDHPNVQTHRFRDTGYARPCAVCGCSKAAVKAFGWSCGVDVEPRKLPPLRKCARCLHTWRAVKRSCPRCGSTPPEPRYTVAEIRERVRRWLRRGHGVAPSHAVGPAGGAGGDRSRSESE